MKNKNISLFNKWALDGKDVSMEKGHTQSVNYMITLLKEKLLLKKKFNFLDLGCGNGWVVKKISRNKFCNLAVGIDGAKNMIRNAKENSNNEIFINENIENWNFDTKFDIIFSMETLYYMKNINDLIDNISKNLLKENGSIIIGIDHYSENTPSLTWGEDYNLDINTLSSIQWKKLFTENKFQNIEIDFFGKKDDWNGTMILYAENS